MTDEDTDEERQVLIGNGEGSEPMEPTVQFKTYKRRWLVLLLFSSLSFLQVEFALRIDQNSNLSIGDHTRIGQDPP